MSRSDRGGRPGGRRPLVLVFYGLQKVQLLLWQGVKR